MFALAHGAWGDSPAGLRGKIPGTIHCDVNCDPTLSLSLRFTNIHGLVLRFRMRRSSGPGGRRFESSRPDHLLFAGLHRALPQALWRQLPLTRGEAESGRI